MLTSSQSYSARKMVVVDGFVLYFVHVFADVAALPAVSAQISRGPMEFE